MSDLANRCRPTTLNDVWGNEQAKETLTNLVKNENRPQVYLFTGNAGCGKAQPVDTIIPTPTGDKRLGDLVVGDYVFDRKGQPTKVIGVYDRGMLDTYRVTLKDRRSTLCNDDHLFTVYKKKGKETMSVGDMLDRGLRQDRGYRFGVAMNGAVEYDIHPELPIHPYVLGAFLANGCCTCKQALISTNDEFVVSKCADLIGKKYKKCCSGNYSWCFYATDRTEKRAPLLSCATLFSAVKDNVCVLAHKKSIPYKYFYSSKEDRLALLQGLLDSDGCVLDGFRLCVSYSSSSIELAQGVVRLCLSLGISAHMTTYVDTRKCNPNYRVYIAVANDRKDELFTLPRKLGIINKYKHRKIKRNYNVEKIVSIENLHYKSQMRCIKVDNEEELYLTNDFIVTHNTTLARAMCNELNIDPVDVTEINMSDHTGVDDARAIIENAGYSLGSAQATILDEVQYATANAQSALLKLLEEPPADSYYFLCTTDPQKLSTALKTRCVQIQVNPLDPDLLAKYLRKVCKEEGIRITTEVLDAIADKADGVPRMALKLLDKVNGMDEDKALEVIKAELSGMIDNPDVKAICQELLKAGSWKTIAANLKNIKNSDAEGVRRMIAGYMTSVLLNSGNPTAATILSSFTESFFNSGYAGLVLACFGALSEVRR